MIQLKILERHLGEKVMVLYEKAAFKTVNTMIPVILRNLCVKIYVPSLLRKLLHCSIDTFSHFHLFVPEYNLKKKKFNFYSSLISCFMGHLELEKHPLFWQQLGNYLGKSLSLFFSDLTPKISGTVFRSLKMCIWFLCEVVGVFFVSEFFISPVGPFPFPPLQ